MRRYIRIALLGLSALLILSAGLAGCGREEAAGGFGGPEGQGFILNETGADITVADPDGREAVLKKKPQRVAVLINSMLDLWYLAGGTAAARVSGEESVPPEAENIEQVGSYGNPNTEKLIALRPDLVILSSTMSSHRELRDILEQSNISSLYVNYSVYDDFVNYLDLFTRLTGREDLFVTRIAEIRGDVEAVTVKTRDLEKPRVLIVMATGTSVQCELPVSLVGDMVRRLGAENIAADQSTGNKARVEFSMERIVERDPDVILATTMGDVEKSRSRLREDIESNAAWAGLRAVKEGRVYYLPKDLYTYKPNARYPEAMEGLAKILYPEAFEDK